MLRYGVERCRAVREALPSSAEGGRNRQSEQPLATERGYRTRRETFRPGRTCAAFGRMSRSATVRPQARRSVAVLHSGDTRKCLQSGRENQFSCQVDARPQSAEQGEPVEHVIKERADHAVHPMTR